MVDKSKMPGDLWVRMMWAPKDPAGIQDRPIVLVGDRRRWLIGLTPTILGFLLLIALALILNDQRHQRDALVLSNKFVNRIVRPLGNDQAAQFDFPEGVIVSPLRGGEQALNPLKNLDV